MRYKSISQGSQKTNKPFVSRAGIMTLVEHIADEHRYAWNTQPRSRIKWEVSSIYLETLHLPEVYDYVITPDGLLDQETRLPIKTFMEKETPLGKIEFDAFEKIENWAIRNAIYNQTEPTAIWISPPHELRSPDTKIIFDQIINTTIGPVLRNYCLLIEGSQYTSIDIVNTLIQTMGMFREPIVDAESIRSMPLLFEKQLDLKFIYNIILERVKSSGLLALKNERENEIQKIAHHWADSYIASRFDNASISIEPVRAEYSVSCPTRKTAFSMMYENATNSFPCPRCDKDIPSGFGITTCPHCGLTKEEWAEISNTRCD